MRDPDRTDSAARLAYHFAGFTQVEQHLPTDLGLRRPLDHLSSCRHELGLLWLPSD